VLAEGPLAKGIAMSEESETHREIFSNLDKFDAYMDSVDQCLKVRHVGIVARVIGALALISNDLNMSIGLHDPLAQKINAWFQKKYGERLKLSDSDRVIVVLIDGDAYKVRLPIIYGRCKVNPLEWIIDATPALLQSLPTGSLDDLCQLLANLYEATQKMYILPPNCTADMRAAVEFLFNQPPQFGLSKWASLQMAEKTFKEAIRLKGARPPNIHNLNKLEKEARRHGLAAVQAEYLAAVQCTSAVRYNEVAVTLEEAVLAHHSAIRICAHIAQRLPSSTVR
jgi:hypothetical protein